jgi:DNA-directed RNA polymerase subunit H (RpoH/RPB5)
MTVRCFNVNAGDAVIVTADNTDNPTSASTGDVIKVTTSSDTVATSTPTFAIVAARAVGSPTLTLSSNSAGATESTYTVGFITSASGSLIENYGAITLAAPTGTVFSSNAGDYTINDLTSGGSCGPSATPTLGNSGATVTFPIGCYSIGSGDTVQVIARNTTNPAVASSGDVIKITTTSDTVPASTPTYPITSASSVAALTGSLSSVAAAATGVTYTVAFTATNGLTENYSTITLAAPTGTVFTSVASNYTVNDLTSGGSCGPSATPTLGNSGATVTFPIGCYSVSPGDSLVVSAEAVANPTTTSSGDVLKVSTSSDTAAAATATYAIVRAVSVSGPSVALLSNAPGASGVTYDLAFTPSANGALISNNGTVTLAAPVGTVFSTNYGDYSLSDTTQDVNCQLYPIVTSNNGATTTGTVHNCNTLNPGDHIVITANNITNPPTASSGDVIDVSTSSDSVPVATPAYSIGGVTTTVVTATPTTSPEIYGKSVSYDATVTSPGGTPTGTVAFVAGTTKLCTVTLSAGTGKCSSVAAPTGADVITGTYSGDSNFLASSGTTSLSVAQAAAKTTVTATPSPASYGQVVTYKATIADATTGSTGTPTGTVAITTGSTALCTVTLSAGTGTCTSAAAPTGSDTVTGTYSGDTNFLASSGTTSLTVVQAGATTTVTATPPSDFYGQVVTYGATVADATSGSTGTPTGTVVITTGSTALCTVTLSAGTGTCTSAAAPTGSDTVTGTYSGDTNFTGSSGTTSVTAAQAASAVTVTSSKSSTTYGVKVTYSATVTDATPGSTGTPTGTVAITTGSTALCTVTLSAGTGTCTSNAAPAGSDSIIGSYSGDTNFVASTGSTSVVAKATTGTVVTATPSSSPDTYGQSVTYGATVTNTAAGSTTTPGGTVAVTAGTTALCTITLSAGTGTCTATTAPVGTDTIKGTYAGNSNFATSNGTTTLAVSQAASAIVVTAAPSSDDYGQVVTYGATVSDATSGSTGTPTGTVAFTAGTTKLCTVTLSDGTGTCTSAAAPTGSDTVTGTYTSTTSFATSSGTAALVVSQSASATTVTVTPTSVAPGKSVTYKATITDATSGSTGIPTGTVLITTGSTTLCTVTLAKGSDTGSCGSKLAPAGSDTITASYSGDTNFTDSGTTTLTVT